MWLSVPISNPIWLKRRISPTPCSSAKMVLRKTSGTEPWTLSSRASWRRPSRNFLRISKPGKSSLTSKFNCLYIFYLYRLILDNGFFILCNIDSYFLKVLYMLQFNTKFKKETDNKKLLSNIIWYEVYRFKAETKGYIIWIYVSRNMYIYINNNLFVSN